MAPKYRCSGDMPAAHVSCSFATDSLAEASAHFERTSHYVDDLSQCVYCDEPITELQTVEYGLDESGNVAYVSHTADYHNERASLLRESARIINARRWS